MLSLRWCKFFAECVKGGREGGRERKGGNERERERAITELANVKSGHEVTVQLSSFSGTSRIQAAQACL